MSDDNIARATVKDTYDLVNQTRQEVNGRIDSLGQKFDFFVTSNEHRLTVLETHQAAQSLTMNEIVKRVDKHGHDIGTLKDRQQVDEASTSALAESRRTRWSTRERVAIAMSTITLTIVTILVALHHW